MLCQGLVEGLFSESHDFSVMGRVMLNLGVN